jgi:hypothetical protein
MVVLLLFGKVGMPGGLKPWAEGHFVAAMPACAGSEEQAVRSLRSSGACRAESGGKRRRKCGEDAGAGKRIVVAVL